MSISSDFLFDKSNTERDCVNDFSKRVLDALKTIDIFLSDPEEKRISVV